MEKREYDEKGNLVHFKNYDGYEQWREYDDKGNLVHFMDSDGREWWKEYDEKGNLIRQIRKTNEEGVDA